MRLIFKRRNLFFDISKDEVVRIVKFQEALKKEHDNIIVRLIEGQPTFVLEPSTVINSINDSSKLSSWREPIFLLLLRRDGDVCKALMADSLDWNLKKEL